MSRSRISAINSGVNMCQGIGYDPAVYKVRCSGKYLSVTRVLRSGFSRLSSVGERGEIKCLSPASSARMRRYLRECVSDYQVMVTLTYPDGYGKDGERAKRDLKVFMQRYEYSCHAGGKLWSAFWFMEFQKSGKIHFHIFGTHRIPIKELSRWWYEIVGSENEYHLRAGTNIEKLHSGRDGMLSYARKYANKAEQKQVPDDLSWVGRFWGVFGVKDGLSADAKIVPEMGISKENDNLYNFIASDMREKVKLGLATRLTSCRFGRVYVIHDSKLMQRARWLCVAVAAKGRSSLEKEYWGIN